MAFKEIPIAETISSSLTDFPIYVKPSAITGWGSITLAEAESIRFYADINKTTELPREVVSADEIHVKKSTLIDGDKIYADYDGVRSDYATTATFGAENVWNSNYASRYGLNSTNDSTSNSNNLTANGGVTVGGATGKVGSATTFDGSDDNLETGSSVLTGTGGYTASAWVKLSASSDNYIANITGETTTNKAVGIALRADQSPTQIRHITWANDLDTEQSYSTGTWYLIHVTYDGSTQKTFFNGSEIDSRAFSSINIGTTNTRIGENLSTFGGNFPGDIDESRFLSTDLSADWITTEYNNQNSPSTFFGTAVEADTTLNTTWKFTQQSGQFSGSSKTNFPAYVDLTEIGTLTQAQADSIRVYSDASLTTELAREVVSTEELHVKIPTFTSGDEIWIDVDGIRSDYATTATFGAENVWNSNYLFVGHGDEASGALLDSTSNSISWTDNNTVGSGTGQLGDARDFVQANNEYFSSTDTILGSSLSAITMQSWFYMRGTGADVTDRGIIQSIRTNGNASNYSNWLQAGSDNSVTDDIRFGLRNSSGTRVFIDSTQTYTHQTWNMVHGTWDGSTMKIFLNGSQDATTGSFSGTIDDTGTDKAIGSEVGGANNNANMKGLLDEVRILSTDLSSDWITTEYNNQNSPSTFWSIAEVADRRIFNIS